MLFFNGRHDRERLDRAILQRDRQIGLRAHFLQCLALGGKELLDTVIEGDDLAAEHVLARRARQRVVEVLLQIGAVPQRQNMHARIGIAETRDECVLRIECDGETLDELAEERGAGFGCRTFVYQPQYVQVLLFHGCCLRCRRLPAFPRLGH